MARRVSRAAGVVRGDWMSASRAVKDSSVGEAASRAWAARRTSSGVASLCTVRMQRGSRALVRPRASAAAARTMGAGSRERRSRAARPSSVRVSSEPAAFARIHGSPLRAPSAAASARRAFGAEGPRAARAAARRTKGSGSSARARAPRSASIAASRIQGSGWAARRARSPGDSSPRRPRRVMASARTSAHGAAAARCKLAVIHAEVPGSISRPSHTRRTPSSARVTNRPPDTGSPCSEGIAG